MNLYTNEEAAWQRLVDLQREIEYSHLIASQGLPRVFHLVRLLGERAWSIAGLAMRRAPRPQPAAVLRVARCEDELACRVA